MRTFAHTLAHFPLGSFIFELTQTLLVPSVRKRELEREELQLSEGVKDSLKGNAEQVTSATELNSNSRFISPFFPSIFHLPLTPTVTIHTHTHHPVSFFLLRRAVSVSWWPCLCADVMGNSCCISLLALSFSLLPPPVPPLLIPGNNRVMRVTPSVLIFCVWSFIDKRSSFTDLLWNVSAAVFEEKQMMITFWFPIILSFLSQVLLYISPLGAWSLSGTSCLNLKLNHFE